MEAIVSDEIVTALTDTRLYRFIRLPNGLCALLVYDPEVYSNKEEEELHDPQIYSNEEEEELRDLEIYSNGDEEDEDEGSKEIRVDGSAVKEVAAAMCVGVGSFSDPKEAQGLAHFLEHMLFMGSALFPDENEYDSYLSEHGGFSNADTDTERTCYFFSVKGDFLKGALTRFAQFFISPLVKAEAMEREILSVDSEFNRALQDDFWRLQQLQCHTSASGHPFNKFTWGNKKSLSDAMERGIHLREHIMKLYNDYYHGELMKLVVIGGESLDILEGWVRELFAGVKKGSLVKPETCLDDHGPIWKAGKIYKLEAVEDVHLLHLSWTLPSLQEYYLTKAEEYFSYLLGHEGKGSLYFLLKAKGWASSLEAGVGNDGMNRSSIAYIFHMEIHLTYSGLKKIFDIIGFVYQYLKRLRLLSPQEWIFNELQDIGKSKFVLEDEQSQDDCATKLAAQLHVYPPEHVIYGEYAFESWDEEMINYILGFFNPRNMRVDLQTKSFHKSLGLCFKRERKKSLGSTCQGTILSRLFFWGVRRRKKPLDIQLEPWFGFRYVEKDIPHALMKLWKDPPKIDSSLQLPLKNKFITRDFSICANKETCESAEISSSRCIIDEPMMGFCYKPDKTLNLPLVNAYFHITLKSGCSSLRNSLLSELFALVLKDELNEIIYETGKANLGISISLHHDKLTLEVSGLIDKIPVLLSEVLAVVKSFSPKDYQFRVIKEDMARTIKNTIVDPINQCDYSMEQVLYQSFWTIKEKLSMLSNLSLADLKVFIPDLLSQLYIEGHCHGNLMEREALNISDIFKSNFSVPSLSIEMRHKERVVCLPSSADLVRDVRVKNKLETNSIVRLYFQIEPNSFELYALVVLFGDLVSEKFFNVLRTKEQLGYDVQCWPWVTYGILGYYFQIQSSKFNPVYLLERIDNFINGLEEMLNGFNNDSFENYRSASMNKLRRTNLPFFTNRIGQGQNICNRCSNDILEFGVAESFEKSDVINWCNIYLKKPSRKCRRLAIRVWGCNTDMKILNEQPSYRQELKDVEAFKNSSDFYEFFDFDLNKN